QPKFLDPRRTYGIDRCAGMASPSVKPESIEFADIQGLLVSAYGNLPCAAYLICEIRDPERTRQWLRLMAPRIKDATGKDEVSSLSIAFTADGLRALGLPNNTLATFSFAFKEGMTPEYRARILGDTGENAPAKWRWGGPSTRPVHVLLMVFARDEVTLAS